MPFAYLKDPLFLACFALYWCHRVARGVGWTTPILSAYLNDVICVAFWLPIMLWVHRRIRVRLHDGPPEGFEIVIPATIWAMVFEVALPATPWWRNAAVADPNDVLCYFAGGLFAMLFWQWRYGRAAASTERA